MGVISFDTNLGAYKRKYYFERRLNSFTFIQSYMYKKKFIALFQKKDYFILI